MFGNEEEDFETIGPLQVLRVTGEKDAPTIVLFHGFGASAHDLYPLHEVITTEQRFNWIFPQGMLKVPIMPGYEGRAWFPIDLQALQEAMQKNDFRDFSEIEPEGLSTARTAAILMIQALGIPFDQLILGGFSQGAMLATDIALRNTKLAKGLMLLSGTLLCEAEWSEMAKSKANLRFFQSHGESDPILGFRSAKKLEKLMRNAGLLGEFIQFPGGHEIPQVVVQGVSRYLNSLS